MAVALAEAIIDPSMFGTGEAGTAAQLYRELSGSPDPLIALSRLSLDATRRSMALGAIRSIADGLDSVTVFGFACDAVWQLMPFLADTAYAARWVLRRHDYWPDLSIEVLEEAFRLLGPAGMRPFAPILSALNNSALRTEFPSN